MYGLTRRQRLVFMRQRLRDAGVQGIPMAGKHLNSLCDAEELVDVGEAEWAGGNLRLISNKPQEEDTGK